MHPKTAASLAWHWDSLILLQPHLLLDLAHICCYHSSSDLIVDSSSHLLMQMSLASHTTVKGNSLPSVETLLTALPLQKINKQINKRRKIATLLSFLVSSKMWKTRGKAQMGQLYFLFLQQAEIKMNKHHIPILLIYELTVGI